MFTDQPFHPLVSDHPLPERFTFPFYYEPHPLSVQAAEELQAYLVSQTDFEHNFGLSNNPSHLLEIPKMFGVMVVQDGQGQLGYLAAFSGKLAEQNYLKGFVPPVYDTLDPMGFYKIGERKLNEYNAEIAVLESNTAIAETKLAHEHAILDSEEAIKSFKAVAKNAKKNRKQQREKAKQEISEEAYDALLEELKNQSLYFHFRLRDLKEKWLQIITQKKEALDLLLNPIIAIKEQRKQLSSQLQKQLHQQYRFLNAKGQSQDLIDIFARTTIGQAPAGSGECAAPKLLQYAYQHDMKPIALAEFWWGASAKDEVRKHQHYYPSCRGKCEPILGHMLQGLHVDPNPMLRNPAENKSLSIVYEDEYLLLVNKPSEFLSVPGKTITDSVQTRLKARMPEATGALLVHRLDMSTSGLLLVAKSEEIHKALQKQFIQRSVKKRYVALLDRAIATEEGYIDLPLRVDLNDRPRQMVCYEHGKSARTRYEVVAIEDGRTRIHFYPITGRTHQLRVHAAHPKGLDAPMVGDDLYGSRADRLHLHAERLEFVHPVTNEVMVVECKAEF